MVARSDLVMDCIDSGQARMTWFGCRKSDVRLNVSKYFKLENVHFNELILGVIMVQMSELFL